VVRRGPISSVATKVLALATTKWEEPRFSRREVDEAGRVLVDPGASIDQRDAALGILDNWRSSHSFPLNSFQMNLRNKSSKICESALVSQRLKRTPSVENKLRLYPSIALSKMQDIGGCRTVVRTVSEVKRIHDAFLRSSAAHKLVRQKDYIASPRPSGYRSLHLIYSFRSSRSTEFEGLQIEVQVRTRLQHAWATAVETVGFFLNQALKSSLGEKQWLDFFRIASAAFAFEEKTPWVPNTPHSREELRLELERMAQELQVEGTLSAFGQALRESRTGRIKDIKYYLLSLRPMDKQLTIRGYRKQDIARATDDYLQAEKQLPLFPVADTVLVAASSLDALRKAYPNYFLDTKVFLEKLLAIMSPSRIGSSRKG
jgi:ppGpp synthetase/RelA/SpoT-type nucleotidyltranferase